MTLPSPPPRCCRRRRPRLGILLDAYLLDKAIYEIGYELNNRPEWAQIPLKGLLELFETER